MRLSVTRAGLLLPVCLLMACAGTADNEHPYLQSRLTPELQIPPGLSAPAGGRDMRVPALPATTTTHDDPALLAMPPGFSAEK